MAIDSRCRKYLLAREGMAHERNLKQIYWFDLEVLAVELRSRHPSTDLDCADIGAAVVAFRHHRQCVRQRAVALQPSAIAFRRGQVVAEIVRPAEHIQIIADLQRLVRLVQNVDARYPLFAVPYFPLVRTICSLSTTGSGG